MDAGEGAGITHVMFGDLFLADLPRLSRGAARRRTGMTPCFRFWQRPTDALARDMIAAGVEAQPSASIWRNCPQSFAGRSFDRGAARALPADVEPCGENGEFHSFVAAGPMLVATHRREHRQDGGPGRVRLCRLSAGLSGAPGGVARSGTTSNWRSMPRRSTSKVDGVPIGAVEQADQVVDAGDRLAVDLDDHVERHQPAGIGRRALLDGR